MKAELIKNEQNEVTIKIAFDEAEFNDAIKYSYNKNKGSYRIPGFRKGKAPRGVIERQYGEGIFYEDAANKLISDKYDDAIKELELEPKSKADIDIESIGKEGLTITACFAVEPEFELGDYMGLEIEKVDTEVTDDMVDQRIKAEQQKNGRIETVSRPALEGDIVNIDFVGTVDGEEFEGGEMKDHDLTLGSGAFIPGFEDQLLEKSAGDDVDVKVTFPEDYRAEHLAGKEAVFACHINDVKEVQLPDLDDDFAKDVSEFDTFEEYRDSVKKEIEEELKKNAEDVRKSRVLLALADLVDLVDVELPEKMVQTEIDDMQENLTQQLTRQGLSPKQYYEFLGGEEKLREEMRKDAVIRLKQSMALSKIREKEAFEVTEEDIENEHKNMAEMYNISIDTVKSFFAGQRPDVLKEQIEINKVINMLVENAVEVEKQEKK